MNGEESGVPVEPRRHWSRRVDVLIGFAGGLTVWFMVLAVYIISSGGTADVDSPNAEEAAVASFETAAGGPGLVAAEDDTGPLDSRVNAFPAGHFQLGMSLPVVLKVSFDEEYVENSVWPQQLRAMMENGEEDGSVNFFGADKEGVASYVLEFCGGTVSRITERRGYTDTTGLTQRQEGDGRGPLGDLQLRTEGQAPEVVLSRQYQHVYDTGRTARINIRYEHGDNPQRVLTLSDSELCRRQMVSR